MNFLEPILFYMIAFTLVTSAILTIFSVRILYSVLFAFVAFVCVGFAYFLLNSPFNAAAQIVIYGVAVSILFVFSVMMTNYNKEKNLYIAIAPRAFLACVGLTLIFFAIGVFAYEDRANEIFLTCGKLNSAVDSVLAMSNGIFTTYIFPFEILSIFLLIAVVGLGVILSFKRGDEE